MSDYKFFRGLCLHQTTATASTKACTSSIHTTYQVDPSKTNEPLKGRANCEEKTRRSLGLARSNTVVLPAPHDQRRDPGHSRGDAHPADMTLVESWTFRLRARRPRLQPPPCTTGSSIRRSRWVGPTPAGLPRHAGRPSRQRNEVGEACNATTTRRL